MARHGGEIENCDFDKEKDANFGLFGMPFLLRSVAIWRRGGKRKESLQLRLWNLNICIENFDAKC